jgi:ribonuclease BN (tRNA processing enzyme)
VGFRLEVHGGPVVSYLSDHEPMLCPRAFARGTEWISGAALAADVDVLVHDSQYTNEEYEARVGWGHSTLKNAAVFAARAGARRLVPFHHDPSHADSLLDKLHHELPRALLGECELTPMEEGQTLHVEPGEQGRA